MLERIVLGLAAEIIIRLWERYSKDAAFQVKVNAAVEKRLGADSKEKLQDASKALQDAMAKRNPN